MAKIKTQSGDLKCRIAFLKERKLDDGYEGHEAIWDHFDFMWSEIMPLSGRERFFSDQLKNEVTHRIRVRYRTDLNEQMRIKYNERYFLINSMIDMEERHRFLELICIEDKTIKE